LVQRSKPKRDRRKLHLGSVVGLFVLNKGKVKQDEPIAGLSSYGQILSPIYPLLESYGICTDSTLDSPKIRNHMVKEPKWGPSQRPLKKGRS